MKIASFLVPASVVALTALVACSGSTTSTSGDGGASSSSSSGGSSGSSGSTSSFCADDAARDAKCGNEADKDCAAHASCYETKLRPGVAAGLEACLTGRACNTGDDQCFADAAAPYANASAPTAFVAACNSKRQACESAGGGSFSDDYCASTIALFTDATIAQLQTCFDKGCTEVRDCFDGITEPLGCN